MDDFEAQRMRWDLAIVELQGIIDILAGKEAPLGMP